MKGSTLNGYASSRLYLTKILIIYKIVSVWTIEALLLNGIGLNQIYCNQPQTGDYHELVQ